MPTVISSACLIGIVILNTFQMRCSVLILSDLLTLLSCIMIWCGTDCLLSYYRSWMVGISMFIFAVHFNIDMVASKLLVKMISDNSEMECVCFIIAWCITVGLSVLIALILKKYMPKLYSMLNGGR